MARILRPTWSTQGDFAPVSTDMNNEGQASRRDALFAPSATDARMSGADRLDQRYQNYQYGPTPEYASETAQQLRSEGFGAQSILKAYGDSAAARGTDIYGRATPGTDYTAANATLGKQGGLYNTLSAYATQGPGPSVAQAQLDANTARAQRAQTSLAMSGRGAGGGAAAQRQALDNSALLSGEANATEAMLAAKEAQDWRQAQLQAYGLGGDVLASQAAQESANAQFDVQAELEAQAQRDQASLGYSQLGLDATTQGFATQLGLEQEARANLENEAQAGQAYEENVTNLTVGKMNADAQKPEEGGFWDTALPIIGAAGSLALMASDEQGKTDVRKTQLSAYENEDDYTDAGWYQRGSRGRAESEMAARQNETFERLEKEREENQKAKDAAEREKKAGAFDGLMKSLAPVLSDERSKKKISALKSENKALKSTLSAYDAAPAAPVQEALNSFTSAPSDAQIARKREELRAQHGSKVAGQFERYAMGLRPKPARFKAEIGPAQDIYTGADEQAFRERTAGAYTADDADQAAFERRIDAAVGPDGLTGEEEDQRFRERIDNAVGPNGLTRAEERQAPNLRPAEAYEYSYKDPKAPGAGPGRYVGPMAQDLEHIPGLVRNTPNGKMVDGGRAAMVGLAAQGENQRRLDRLEAYLGAGPTTGIADRRGRNVPILGQSAETPYDPRTMGAIRRSQELTPEEQDEIERQFFDPPDRYRTYAL